MLGGDVRSLVLTSRQLGEQQSEDAPRRLQ